MSERSFFDGFELVKEFLSSVNARTPLQLPSSCTNSYSCFRSFWILIIWFVCSLEDSKFDGRALTCTTCAGFSKLFSHIYHSYYSGRAAQYSANEGLNRELL